MSAIEDLAGLANAWQRSSHHHGLHSFTSSWWDERPSCGSPWILMSSIPGSVEIASERLGELLRLLLAAAPLGPDAYRGVLHDGVPPCPLVQCAWHDEADSGATVEFVLYSKNETALQVLHDALFDWDETSGCRAFQEFHAALQKRRPPTATPSTNATTLGVKIKLHPSCGDAATVEQYTRRLDRLLHTWTTTTESPSTSFRLLSVELHESDLDVQLDEFVSLLRVMLRYPVPQSVVARYSRWMTVSTLVTVCSDGTSPAFVAGLDLCLDSAALRDSLTMSAFCGLLTTQCGRLQRLWLDAAEYDDSDEQHRRSVEMLGTALARGSRLESLSVKAPASVEGFMRSLFVGVGRSGGAPGLRSLIVKTPWSARALLSFVSKCPNLRELTVTEVTREHDAASVDMDTNAGVSPSPSSLPVLTKLLIENGWHPHLLPLMQRSGASLTHLRFVLPLDADGVDVAEAIAHHCPSTWYLKVGDPDSAFFNAIARACDDGRFRRLRQLSVYHNSGPTERTDRGTFTLACLSLLQLLCDPSRRLTQRLQVLEMKVPRQEATVIKQAMDLMLRCNSSIVVAELETCEHSQHAATRADTATEGDVTASDAAVRRTLSEMVALAGGKVAIPNDDVLPDVIIPPSLRCRLALVSVLARGGIVMPAAVLRNVFAMAGRHTRRHTRL